MPADLEFILEWNSVREAPLTTLRAALKKWLARAKPVCLIHPHGFLVLLLRRTEKEEWRLHFWPREPRIVTGMPAFIHTHNCHVSSRIIKGSLKNILHDVIAVSHAGNPLYEVGYGGDRYTSATSNVLRKTLIRVEASPQRECLLTCGDIYHVERNSYHEVVVSAQDAALTLVCMHERSADKVKVVGIDGYPETISFKRTELPTLEICEWLETNL